MSHRDNARDSARRMRLTPEGKAREKANKQKWIRAHPERFRESKRKWYQKNQIKIRAEVKIKYEKLRLEVLKHYSNGTLSCVCCGESIYQFLTVDHIEGGGTQQRKILGAANLLSFLLKNDYPKGYRVLCYNCNCGREKNNGICPHDVVLSRVRVSGPTKPV